MLTLIFTTIMIVVILWLLAKVGGLPVLCYGLTCVEVAPTDYLYFNEKKQTVYCSDKNLTTVKWFCLAFLAKSDCGYAKLSVLRNAQAVTTGDTNNLLSRFISRISDRVPVNDARYHRQMIDFEATDIINDAFRDEFVMRWIYSLILRQNGEVLVRFKGERKDQVINVTLPFDCKLRKNLEKMPYLNYVGGCVFVFLADCCKSDRKTYHNELYKIVKYVIAFLSSSDGAMPIASHRKLRDNDLSTKLINPMGAVQC